MPNAIRKYVDNISRTEGRRGVIELCKLARAAGYHDTTYYGQLDQGAYLGDLVMMLEDNSCMVEAILKAAVKINLPLDEVDDETAET